MRTLCLASLLALLSSPALAAEIKPGAPAPTFQAIDSKGETHKLSDYKGKWVVLEWLNHGCPFVRKHYDSKNMQGLQKAYTEKGVVWLSIISSAEGKQGYSTADKANADVKANGASPSAVLLDAEGVVGKLYGAKTTPHMFVIDPKGVVVYAGAIDDNSSWKPETVKGAKNYVAAALDAALAGQAVATPSTKPYGCSVKY